MVNSPLMRVAALLFAVDALLVIAYLVGSIVVMPDPPIYRLVNLDGEASLGAWFSASQLLLTGVVFVGAAYVGGNTPASRGFLVVTGLAFMFLSADEAAAIHEKITTTLKHLEFLPRFSGDHGIWIPLYIGTGLAYLALTFGTWTRLWKHNTTGTGTFLVGVGLFVFGGVVLEIVSYGPIRELSRRAFYPFQVALEEAFELFGVTTILIGAFRMCFRSDGPNVSHPPISTSPG